MEIALDPMIQNRLLQSEAFGVLLRMNKIKAPWLYKIDDEGRSVTPCVCPGRDDLSAEMKRAEAGEGGQAPALECVCSLKGSTWTLE